MIKSPIFYMGNKYALLDDLLTYFPKKDNVNQFIDIFGGSGVVSLNVPYDNIQYNELNEQVFNLLHTLKNTHPDDIIRRIRNNIDHFNLPLTTTDLRTVDTDVRNKANVQYLKFRSYYNSQQNKDYLDLYTLTFYSFSNIIRFNLSNEFNVPFGNRCFLFGQHDINIRLFHKVLESKVVAMTNLNAFDILKGIATNDNTFIYLDPPYTNTLAPYNEQRAGGGWTIDDDYKLFDELDRLTTLGVKWGLSNVLVNKGIHNHHLKKWADKQGYEIIHFEDKTYSALGKGNANTEEVYIVNYDTPFKTFDIFDFM